MLARPSIITRRALLTGAAALAAYGDLTRPARAANTIKWNSADKSVDLSLSGNSYHGSDTTLYNPATAGWRSARSTWSATSGKHFFQLVYGRTNNSTNPSAIVGVVDGSASLASYVGSDAHGFGVQGVSTYTNGATVSSSIPGPVSGGTSVFNLCVDLDNHRLKIQPMLDDNNRRTTWYNQNGTSGDPTNTTFGWDISSLSGAVYIGGSAFYQSTAGTNPTVIINAGGWPFVQGTTVPAGYTPPDAAYPLTITPGSHTLTTIGSQTDASLSNLRVASQGVGASGGWRSSISDLVIAPGSDIMFEFLIDMTWNPNSSGNIYVGANSQGGGAVFGVQGDGYSDPAGATGSADRFSGGAVVTVALKRSVNRVWYKTTYPGSSGYWNNSSSADPVANVGGQNISSTSGNNYTPKISIFTERFSSGATINFGALTPTVAALTGFTYPDTPAVVSRRSRGILLQ